MRVEYSEDRKTAFFNGYKFRRDAKTGYYLSSRNTDIGRHERLHRYVWRYFNGDIPEGFHIHHIDENKYHNDIENLECIPQFNHLSLHGRERAEKSYDEMIENLNSTARPKASEWHGSDAGLNWHKQHYESMKEKLHVPTECVCEYCGKKYISTGNGKNRFCSGACSSAARRRSRVDDETRTCAVCGKPYKINKYAKGKTCSGRCRNLFRWHPERYAIGQSTRL